MLESRVKLFLDLNAIFPLLEIGFMELSLIFQAIPKGHYMLAAEYFV